MRRQRWDVRVSLDFQHDRTPRRRGLVTRGSQPLRIIEVDTLKPNHFLMSRLNERDLVGRTIERAEDAIDPITWVAEYPPHAPLAHALNNEITDGLAQFRALKFGIVGRRQRGWKRWTRCSGPIATKASYRMAWLRSRTPSANRCRRASRSRARGEARSQQPAGRSRRQRPSPPPPPCSARTRWPPSPCRCGSTS